MKIRNNCWKQYLFIVDFECVTKFGDQFKNTMRNIIRNKNTIFAHLKSHYNEEKRKDY